MLAAAALSAGIAVCGAAWAGPVGERHLTAPDPTAALRDAQHRPEERVTVWYPAAEGSREESIDMGPPGKPLMRVGAVAADAPFADDRRRPVILFSHGYGGAARSMGWFGIPLARAGYVVVAVDHPGNNALDEMTAPGAVLFWDRAEDLRAALDAALRDPVIGARLDARRLGVAGFSAGGFTALTAAGARGDPDRLITFCHAHPSDGVCLPQKEFPLTLEQSLAALTTPPLRAERARAGEDHSIPGVRAVFAMAPAIIQEMTPDSLRGIRVPTAIILGDADPVAPPAANGLVAARLVPNAQLKTLPGVGHYDFLGDCTPAGKASVPVCVMTLPQEPTHAAALSMALDLFGRTLGKP